MNAQASLFTDHCEQAVAPVTCAIRYGSVCSGIEAMSVAMAPEGWRADWFAEIEPFPSAVLAHHYPAVPNLGDMTHLAVQVLQDKVTAPDVLVGGTPCQAFSLAGSRASLADDRGNLTLRFVELADAIDHVRARHDEPGAIVWWENVPGVLSTPDNAFGCILARLAGNDEPLQPPGGRWANAGAVYGPRRAIAWRTLDAQYFGLAQRRRRVFVVASARNGFDPAAVLFEWDRVRRDTPPCRATRQQLAGGVEISAKRSGYTELSPTLNAGASVGPRRQQLAPAVLTLAHGQGHAEVGIDQSVTLTCLHEVPMVAHALCGEASEDGSGRGVPIVPIGFSARQSADSWIDQVGTLDTLAGTQAVAIPPGEYEDSVSEMPLRVRRLTPRECERLQGFPDDYTAIPYRGKPAADAPRYRALGNSMATTVMRWIGRRIDEALRNTPPDTARG